MHNFDLYIRKYNRILFVLCAFVLLFLNGYDHRYSLLSSERFIENEYGSERFVISRLIHDLQKDPSAFGDLMVAFVPDEGGMDFHSPATQMGFKDKQTRIEEALASGQQPPPYFSHAAFQLQILRPLWFAADGIITMVSDKKPDSKKSQRLQEKKYFYIYKLSGGFLAALSALVLTGFLLWVRFEFSPVVGWLVLAGILLFLPTITYFSRNLWWMMWLFYMPMVVSLWGTALAYKYGPKLHHFIWIGLASGLFIFMRVACGYEYASTIMMSALVPVFYYAVKARISFKQFVAQSFVLGSLVMAGFLAAFYYHYLMLDAAGQDAAEIIKNRFMLRASDNAAIGDGMIAESVRSSLFLLILKYIFAPFKIAPPQILYMLWPLAWGVLYYKSRSYLPAINGLYAAMGASIIGALSMLVILKGHAYIHGYDIVIWTLPLNLFILILMAVVMEKKIFKRQEE
jgi:hypothetical protein